MQINKNYDTGIAYQVDRSKPIQYNIKYYDRLNAYRKNVVLHDKINEIRRELVKQYVPEWKHFLDIGCGNLDFLDRLNKSYILSHGYDIMPKSIKKLKEINAYIDINAPDALKDMYGVSLWDVLEHLPNPKELLEKIPRMCFVFISIPIFDNLDMIEDSKHYRPNEHLWYFTHNGMLNFMKGFKLVEYNDNETDAGREGIRTYVFRKQNG